MSEFLGFKESQITNPKASTSQTESSSSSEVSDFETAADSGETTPTRSYSNPKTDTVQKNKGGRQSVRQLIDHFSSDSDSTSENRRTTRRKKSLTAEHTQLPPGGEKEIRRNMAEQTKADKLVNLYKAMAAEFIVSMNEADQSLNQNPDRTIKLGFMASLADEFEALDDYWKKIVEANDIPAVEIDFVQLMLARNKSKGRFHRIKGAILASTEIQPVVAPTTTTVRVTNPTSFGNLKLPEFWGDYVEFDNFEAQFRNTISNGNLDEGGKLAHLLNNLKGEARDYIGYDGLALKTYEQVWLELRSRYGKPWRVTRAAVKKVLDLQDPSEDPKDISRYWNQVTETCKVAERLKLSATSLILNMALLKLPTDFRSKMDDKLKVVSDKYILTRDQVAEPFNDVIAGELEKPKSVLATLGFNTATRPHNPTPTGTQQQPKKKTKWRNPNSYWCYLCATKGHKTPECNVYTSGPLVQSRLREMGRCIRCGVPFKEHGPQCSHRVSCKNHPKELHLFYACNDFKNMHHVDPMPMSNPTSSRVQQTGLQNNS